MMGRSRSRSHSRGHERRRRSRSYSRTPSPYEEGVRVHVSDLGIDCSKREIESRFSKYGQLIEVWLARNPPCFAFIVYKHHEDAEEAIREMDGVTVCGSRVRVSLARPRVRGGRMRRNDFNLRCYQCGERGHFSRDCEELRRIRRFTYRRSYSRSQSRSRDRDTRDKKRNRRSRTRSHSKSPRRRGRRPSSKSRSRSRSPRQSKSRSRSRSAAPKSEKIVEQDGGGDAPSEGRNEPVRQQSRSRSRSP